MFHRSPILRRRFDRAMHGVGAEPGVDRGTVGGATVIFGAAVLGAMFSVMLLTMGRR